MKKIMSRYLILAVLLGCLGFISTANFRVRANPPCPLNCHNNCRADYDICFAGCCGDPNCEEGCAKTRNQCLAYCDWVCGPE